MTDWVDPRYASMIDEYGDLLHLHTPGEGRPYRGFIVEPIAEPDEQ